MKYLHNKLLLLHSNYSFIITASTLSNPLQRSFEFVNTSLDLQVESELSGLGEDDRAEFLEALGVSDDNCGLKVG